MTSVLWFRRDLRLRDHPALNAAASSGPVVALFVLDQALLAPSGAPRVAFLLRTLRALDAELRERGGALLVRSGDPARVVTEVAKSIKADAVHVSADFGPYGKRRDETIAEAVRGEGTEFVRTGSPYAVSPGRVLKADGSPYKVYTPFYRAWSEHGWQAPPRTASVDWQVQHSETIPDDPALPDGLELPDAGEQAARRAWTRYREQHLHDYPDGRDRPDLDDTSRMSPYLKWGSIHPRTLLADLGPHDTIFRKELAWREFYADVMHHRPDSAREYYLPAMRGMRWNTPGAAFDAWAEGRTGYPIVDAGMRQLRAQGWMHNRVRMIVASFLVKDLHIEWTLGARHFMRWLVDGDLASNSHGWQWTAGTGTDASPFYRVFNPVGQGKRFDPDGEYVRRWVPELREIKGSAVHEPWRLDQPPQDYPAPIVDHATERIEALDRHSAIQKN